MSTLQQILKWRQVLPRDIRIYLKLVYWDNIPTQTKDSKVLVGVESFEWDGTLKSKFGGEIYAGIGGGAYIAVDWIKVGETIYDFGKAILGCGSQK